MNQRKHEVRLLVSDDELARLDELLVSDDELARLDEQRGVVSRARFIRTLLREPPTREGIATREEVLALLSEQARAGKVAAAIALERALRGEQPASELEDFLRG